MTREKKRLGAISALLFAMAASAALAATPGQTVTLTTTGTTAALPVEATQGLPVSIMVAAPSGGTFEIEGAITAGGPWVLMTTIETAANSNGYDVTGKILQTTDTAYLFPLGYLVPFIRPNVTALTGGSATLGVSQPVIK